MKIQKLSVILALLIVTGVASASFFFMNVQSCAFVSGNGAIHDCPGTNIFGNTPDVTIGKNAVLGLTMADANQTLNNIHDVKVKFNHSGATGISGQIGITLFDQNSSTAFCGEDTSIANVAYPTWKYDTVAACTPTGGWTQTMLDNLEVRIANYDLNNADRTWIDYLEVDVNYS